MYELIICEKPSAAKKIAEALANGKPIKENMNGVPYYKITRGNRDIVVSCAVGHLYGLGEREKKGWIFPVFDIEWKPAAEISKKSAFSKKYLSVIKKLAKEADEFTDNILKAQLSSFSEVTGNSEVPQEKYLEMKDQSIEAGQRLLEMKEFPDVFETHQKEFGDPIEVQKKRNFGDTELGF